MNDPPPKSSLEKAPSTHNQPTRVTGLVVFLLAGLSAALLLPVADWLESLNTWIAEPGAVGILLFIGLYILCTILLFPGAVLTIGAGFAFGLLWGFIAVSVGSTIGAAVAFLLGRSLARQKVAAMTQDRPRFRQIDQAIAKEGPKLILLLRLSPLIPFNLSNYFYGLTAVKFWPYVLASWLGMAPGTLLYVYLGSVGRAGAEAATGSGEGRNPMEWVLLALGLAATVAVTIWISRIARRAIKNTEISAGE